MPNRIPVICVILSKGRYAVISRLLSSRDGEYNPALALQRAGVAEWQTHGFQKPAGLRPWGFDSPLRHHAASGADGVDSHVMAIA